MMTARALSGNVGEVIWRGDSGFDRSATLPTNYHKIPTLFLGNDNIPAPTCPDRGHFSTRHPINNHTRTLVHIGHTKGRATVELGLICQQIGPPGEDHLAASLGGRDRIV